MKVITFGRSSQNNVVINDNKVSRVHCQIVQHDNGSFDIVDFGSANGTFVNGRRINGEITLSSNDIVRIGNTLLPWLRQFYDISATDSTQTCAPDNNMETVSANSAQPSAGCAKIHVYRRKNIMGFAISPSLYLNGNCIGEIKNNRKKTVTVDKPGVYVLSAKTEVKREIKLDVEFGKEYYIRFGLSVGFFVGHPKFELMSATEAISDMRNLKVES
jgi:pSer/pThr/pTyr-binding forkhead associated (FHA) protein